MGYFENSRRRVERINVKDNRDDVAGGQVGLTNGRNAVIGPDYVTDDGEVEQRGGWQEQAVGDEGAVGTRSWQEMADRVNAARSSANQGLFDGYMGIIQTAKNDIALNNQRKMVAGAAMLQSAYDNGGMSDRALGAALSETVGQPIYGCQILSGLTGEEAKFNGCAAVYGQKQDANGNPSVGIVGLIDQKSQLGMLQGSMTGDRTKNLQQFLYDGLSKSYTPEQMQGMGFQNPSGPYVAGQTTISGSATNRLLGRPRQKSKISWFSADGKGGGSRGEYNGHTGERWEENWGTRKVAEEARQTENAAKINAAKKNGLSAQERLAELQLKEKGKNERQEKKLASTSESEEKKSATQYENAMATYDYRMNEHLRKYEAETVRTAAGSEVPRHSKEEVEAERSRLMKERDSYNARMRKAYKIKDEQPTQPTTQSGQAPATKEDNGGDGTTQYKVGDVIGTTEKNGKKYEVYIGDDGKKHARPIK